MYAIPDMIRIGKQSEFES